MFVTVGYGTVGFWITYFRMWDMVSSLTIRVITQPKARNAERLPQHYLMIATKHYATPWPAGLNSIIGFILLMYNNIIHFNFIPIYIEF